jgi:hypothetical protein
MMKTSYKAMGKMKGFLFLCLIFILLVPTPTQVFGHSGRTDSYGGHNKTSNGTYHCHSNPCLDNAWKQAYNEYFPIGQRDGKKGVNESSTISKNLFAQLDPDIAEYMVPYAVKAYKMGYRETFWPAFWEKYGWYIGGATVILLLGIFSFFRRQKKMKSQFADRQLTRDTRYTKDNLIRSLRITSISMVVFCVIIFVIQKYQSVIKESQELKIQISTIKKTNEKSPEKEVSKDTVQEPTQDSEPETTEETIQDTSQDSAQVTTEEPTQQPLSETTKYSNNADPAFIAFYEDTKQEYENLIAEFNKAEQNDFNETQNLISSAEKLKVIVNKDILAGQFEFARQGMDQDLGKLIDDLNAKSPQYEIIQSIEDLQLNYRDILSVTIAQ